MLKIDEQARDFILLVGQENPGSPPRVPDENIVKLRLKLCLEEVFELVTAAGIQSDEISWCYRRILNIIRESTIDVNMEKFADALGDIDYVSAGARIAFGINGEPIADEIHRANMTKFGGPIDVWGKHGKPEGWQAPDISGELRKQGWEG